MLLRYGLYAQVLKIDWLKVTGCDPSQLLHSSLQSHPESPPECFQLSSKYPPPSGGAGCPTHIHGLSTRMLLQVTSYCSISYLWEFSRGFNFSGKPSLTPRPHKIWAVPEPQLFLSQHLAHYPLIVGILVCLSFWVLSPETVS